VASAVFLNALRQGFPMELNMTEATSGQSDAEDSLRNLGFLAASVGHHVINAFSAAVSNAELIRAALTDRSDPAEVEELADSIVRSALAAAQVARRLIDWTRHITAPERVTGSTELEPVDLGRLITEAVEVQRKSAAANVEWDLQLEPVPPLPGSAASLRTMLTYLFDNAREALPGGSGRIAVSTSVDERRWLVIEIRDWGCGMIPEVQHRATEPFFGTKPGRPGIGLTIAQGIWRRHRGALAIESRPGQGTTVRLSYGPLAGFAEQGPTASARAAREAPSDAPAT
jgi:signal transduction histidine kinase